MGPIEASRPYFTLPCPIGEPQTIQKIADSADTYWDLMEQISTLIML
jgi:hypothetical protein